LSIISSKCSTLMFHSNVLLTSHIDADLSLCTLTVENAGASTVFFTREDASLTLALIFCWTLVTKNAESASMFRTTFPTRHIIAFVTTGTLVIKHTFLFQQVTSASGVSRAFLIDAVIPLRTVASEKANFRKPVSNCWISAQAVHAISTGRQAIRVG